MLELETNTDFEDDGLESEPILGRHRKLGLLAEEMEREHAATCPASARVTVSGFPTVHQLRSSICSY
jgi:hypothetical protein